MSEIVEAAETVEEVVEFACGYSLREHAVQAVILSAVVGGGAFFLGRKMTEKKLTAKYESILEREIAEAKAFYSRLHKSGDELDTPEAAHRTLHPDEVIADPDDESSMAEAAKAIRRYQGEVEDVTLQTDDEDDDTIVEVDEDVNVFDELGDSEFDIEEEMKTRTPERPYVIAQEEFYMNELEYEQSSITWYAGDSVLADEHEEEIPLIDETVGKVNLSRFGDGSTDPNIVHIRNERLGMDFEVVYAEGKYAHEVLGLEHSDSPSRGRMRRQTPRRDGSGSG